MAEEKKIPRWVNEQWYAKQPNPTACLTCMFRFIEIEGEKVDRPDAGCCEIYEYPESKPNDVIFEGAECEYYEKG